MSYCVNCGVELDATASACPLCGTPVQNPRQKVDTAAPKPFPTRREEVPPESKRGPALLVTAMLASVAVCCGALNLLLPSGGAWSLYVIGVAAMLWLWLVPPLLMRRMPLLLRLTVDAAAVGVYVLLIALELDGLKWYLGLALPIVLWGGACLLFLGVVLGGGRRSILSTVTLLIGTAGSFLLGVECFVDRFFQGIWRPGWSLVVVAVCVSLIIPLIVVRRVPSLREEVRRRFHF